MSSGNSASAGASPGAPLLPMVSVDRVSRTFGEAHAVVDASFHVDAGRFLTILGPSGSGKTTLLRMIAGFIAPTRGEIFIHGQPVSAVPPHRRSIGMVFQRLALFPHLDAWDNVAYPLRMRRFDAREIPDRVARMFRIVQLPGLEKRRIHELSGGQQQRVGIARSLAVEPEIWFLDEPFSALDPLIRREMQTELMRLQGVLKKTIVFITHDFDEAIRLADRIAIMKDGEIIQIGTPEQLVVNPATTYVAEFTRDVNRAKVMSARSIMQPAGARTRHRGKVDAAAKIASFSAEIISADAPFAVIGDRGRIEGEVTPAAVINLLAGIESGAVP